MKQKPNRPTAGESGASDPEGRGDSATGLAEAKRSREVKRVVKRHRQFKLKRTGPDGQPVYRHFASGSVIVTTAEELKANKALQEGTLKYDGPLGDGQSVLEAEAAAADDEDL